jgi:hypothetical protein
MGNLGNHDSAANLKRANVGSIPIARSINLDDSVDFTRLSYSKQALKWQVLDASWTPV